MITTTEPDIAAMSTAEAERRLQALDLTMVRMKLADRVEGPGWTPAILNLLERDYRRFLTLNLLYRVAICPCKDVDKFWHAHILDTAAYRLDCDAIFGEYLDHFPYFGMRGADDAQALTDAYAATVTLYERHFGTAPDIWRPDDVAKCNRTNC